MNSISFVTYSTEVVKHHTAETDCCQCGRPIMVGDELMHHEFYDLTACSHQCMDEAINVETDEEADRTFPYED
jgi:hypothetical protein